MRRKLQRKLGNGNNVKFWEDLWLGHVPLKTSHNRIFLVSAQKRNKVSEMGEWEGEEWRWKLEWRRGWFEWEGSLLTSFMQVLDSISLRRDTQDGWTWNNNSAVPYSVKEVYAMLLQQQEQQEPDIFSTLWSSLIPSKVNAFRWRLLLNRVQTKDNLAKWGIIPQGGNLNCGLCGM